MFNCSKDSDASNIERGRSEEPEREESKRSITLPSIVVSYSQRKSQSNTRNYAGLLTLSGWDANCEKNQVTSLSEDGKKLVVATTTRTLLNVDKLYSAHAVLRETYKDNKNGSEHRAKTAARDAVRENHLEGGVPKPWLTSIPLPDSCTAITTVEGLKNAEENQGVSLRENDFLLFLQQKHSLIYLCNPHMVKGLVLQKPGREGEKTSTETHWDSSRRA